MYNFIDEMCIRDRLYAMYSTALYLTSTYFHLAITAHIHIVLAEEWLYNTLLIKKMQIIVV